MSVFSQNKDRIAEELEPVTTNSRELAHKLGLEPYDVNWWVVDYDEMNELIAYGGFQKRYPHWRWAMKYDKQSKQSQYLGGKAFEIVNNDDPSHAFLQASNALADQKAVITHVEAHADFFANNDWFHDNPNAAEMLAQNSERIQEFMEDPEIGREAVEKFIDNLLCLESTIDQHSLVNKTIHTQTDTYEESSNETSTIEDRVEELDITDTVKERVFDEEWMEEQTLDSDEEIVATDVVKFFRDNGKQYDDDEERAVDFEPWQREVIDMLWREFHYFAPQKMTKVMNEGWAAYWESMMMGEEMFAGANEFIHYANHQAAVLNSPGFNPYKLGKELWEYIENSTNRRHIVDNLLRVEGINPRNFHSTVDFAALREELAPDEEIDAVTEETLSQLDPDNSRVDADNLEKARNGEINVDKYPWKVFTYEGLAERHYSLTKPQNIGYIEEISKNKLESVYRYMADPDRYASISEALEDIDYTVAWDRMREIRQSHNDITFIDEFVSEEFIETNNYWTYDFNDDTKQFEVSSKQLEDVKKKLLLKLTNFGKPTIYVADDNWNNTGELMLDHQYNGVMLDREQAKGVLERTFNLWGRPVHLRTIVKYYDDDQNIEEAGLRITYDGENIETERLNIKEVDHLTADDVDYDTKPESFSP